MLATLPYAGTLVFLLLSEFSVKVWMPFVVAAAGNLIVSCCMLAVLMELCTGAPASAQLDQVTEKRPPLKVTFFSAVSSPDETLPDNCCICLEALDAELGRLACGHVFHATCIGHWVEAKRNCPMRCPSARVAFE